MAQAPKLPEEDYYTNEDGYLVFTERFHLKRGSCCGNRCRHCPYDPPFQRGNRKVFTVQAGK